MSTTHQATPDTSGDTLAELSVRLERIEALWAGIVAELGLDQRIHVDLGDPLAPYRTAGGDIAYETIPVTGLRCGDWFQRGHGDTGWHDVRQLITADTQVGVVHGPTGLEWFARSAAVRVARPAAHVVAVQEHRAAGR